MAMILTTIFYFAYGSNLLLERIHINNPSATRYGIGKVENYRLDFDERYSVRWRGAPATIVPDNTSYVWGAIYKISVEDITSLDNQEGVGVGDYVVANVTAVIPTGESILCRSYVAPHPLSKIEEEEDWPEKRKPSKVYIDTVVRGAKESDLPPEYVEKLKRIPFNNFTGPVNQGAYLITDSGMTASSKFLYFAYGSNLLLKRIHISNPTASRIGIGKLKDYRLDFNYKSKRWNGAASTIVPDNSSYVWGALYEISTENMASLDDQEGVSLGIYKVVLVTVETPEGKELQCRSYQLVNLPPKLKEGEILPEERKPSKVYLDTIVEGAVESGLPSEYIEQLKRVPDNGYSGPVNYNID